MFSSFELSMCTLQAAFWPNERPTGSTTARMAWPRTSPRIMSSNRAWSIAGICTRASARWATRFPKSHKQANYIIYTKNKHEPAEDEAAAAFPRGTAVAPPMAPARRVHASSQSRLRRLLHARVWPTPAANGADVPTRVTAVMER